MTRHRRPTLLTRPALPTDRTAWPPTSPSYQSKNCSLSIVKFSTSYATAKSSEPATPRSEIGPNFLSPKPSKVISLPTAKSPTTCLPPTDNACRSRHECSRPTTSAPTPSQPYEPGTSINSPSFSSTPTRSSSPLRAPSQRPQLDHSPNSRNTPTPGYCDQLTIYSHSARTSPTS